MKTALPCLLTALLLSGCTLLRVSGGELPNVLETDGLLDAHVSLGIPDESDLLDVELLDGTSSGSFFELRLWKLLRLELGLAGVDVGVGPLDLGLGILAYEPETWHRAPRPAPAPAPAEPGAPRKDDVEPPTAPPPTVPDVERTDA